MRPHSARWSRFRARAAIEPDRDDRTDRARRSPAHIVSGIALCITIIGIPLGIAEFKMVPVSLAPLGKQIVSTRRGPFDAAVSGR